METMKRKWGKPVTEVQKFVPQDFVVACSLPEESKLLWALSQEFNGEEGRQTIEERTFTNYYFLLNPEPTQGTGTWPPSGTSYFTWHVTDFKVFYSTDGKHFEETTNPFETWAPSQLGFDHLENTFYRANKFDYLTITDETKNLS